MNAQRARRLWLPVAAVLSVTTWAIFALMSAGAAFAQLAPVSVGLLMASESVTVGEVFTLTLSATHPPDYHVAFPQLPATWGEFEVRDQAALPTTFNEDGSVRSSMTIDAALFSPGQHPTPALSVAIRRPDGSVVNRPVRPIDITVESVLIAADRELREIKQQVNVQLPILSPVASPAFGIITALAVVGAVAAFLLRKRLMQAAMIAQGDRGGPMAVALGELDRIERLRLPAKREFKEHYTLVSDCLRVYMRGQFGIQTQEMTTRDIVGELKTAPVTASDIRDVGGILDESDLVKFARLIPNQEDAAETVSVSRGVVQDMTPAGVSTTSGDHRETSEGNE